MSDVHGFALALDAVLADLSRQGKVDEIIVAGDLCEVGPAPADVLATLRGSRYTVLQGNTDRNLAEAASGVAEAGDVGFALEQIGDAGVRYLAGLRFSRRITPPGGSSPKDDLLAVHANPHDLDRRLHPEMTDGAVREVLGATRAAIVAFGHVHIAYTRQVDATLLADVSAVGNPKDRDLRSKYGLFSWDAVAREWKTELRRVPYPLAETAAQIRASHLPNPEWTLRTLERASY